jgi:hypothetical protein
MIIYRHVTSSENFYICYPPRLLQVHSYLKVRLILSFLTTGMMDAGHTSLI